MDTHPSADTVRPSLKPVEKVARPRRACQPAPKIPLASNGSVQFLMTTDLLRTLEDEIREPTRASWALPSLPTPFACKLAPPDCPVGALETLGEPLSPDARVMLRGPEGDRRANGFAVGERGRAVEHHHAPLRVTMRSWAALPLLSLGQDLAGRERRLAPPARPGRTGRFISTSRLGIAPNCVRRPRSALPPALGGRCVDRHPTPRIT